MSVDINWDTVTSGPDGEALAEKIRDFIHDKFQQITLPRFINSVHVHSFEFGSKCPVIEIKDVCDPLPEFYEDEESDEDQDTGLKDEQEDLRRPSGMGSTHINKDRLQRLQDQILNSQAPANSGQATRQSRREETIHADTRRAMYGVTDHHTGLFPRSGTPGLPGGTSNIGYFNLPLSGLSGSQTPLAAVASGTPFNVTGWNHDLQTHSTSTHHGHSTLASAFQPHERNPTSNHRQPSGSPTRPSTANTLSPGSPFSPASPESLLNSFHPAEKVSDDLTLLDGSSSSPPGLRNASYPSQPSDLQVVARVKYAGDVRMTLTTEILLDYPMPSFVGIPLKLSIKGITFDGVAITAYIKKRMHFCFLSPEDAAALVGDLVADEEDASGAAGDQANAAPHGGVKKTIGGLLQEIRVESEIGKKENGKQVLKNLGKVEKFVLEQVRRIFEEEFVFPSFWTFLV